jgi:hypothetical protein
MLTKRESLLHVMMNLPLNLVLDIEIGCEILTEEGTER